MSKKRDFDVAIIGGGPAGMTAAIYAARAGQSVVVFEKSAVGGQIINSSDIRNYPAAPHISGVEFASKLQAQAEEVGAEVRFEEIDKIEKGGIIRSNKGTYRAGAVILATGAGHRKLGLSNEKKLVSRGVSYCATCDGGFFKGKTVAVVGGGDTALDDALYLANLAEKVYLIHRRDEFRGSKRMVAKLQERENVEFVLDSVVCELLEVGGKLSGIKVLHNNSGESRVLEVSGLFVAIGQGPETQEFAELLKLDVDGYAIAEEDCITEIPGVFVAGDIRKKSVRQLVTATADGAVAAKAAIEFLNNL